MSNESTQTSPPEAEVKAARRRGRLHSRMHANPALSLTTKLLVTTLGTLVIVTGLVMLVTPGPGLLGIVVGLGILATEYDWADRWLVAARRKLHEARLRAESMDPKVRRRRLMLTGAGFLAVTGAVVTFVVVIGWPHFALAGWDWLQGIAGWVPDLPGM